MNIGEKIKQIPNDKNLSQQGIADKISMHRVQYTRLETGKTEPTVSILEKVAQALEVDITDLFKTDISYDVTTYDKSLVDKVRMIDELGDSQKKSISNIIDMAIANKKLRDTLSAALNLSH